MSTPPNPPFAPVSPADGPRPVPGAAGATLARDPRAPQGAAGAGVTGRVAAEASAYDAGLATASGDYDLQRPEGFASPAGWTASAPSASPAPPAPSAARAPMPADAGGPVEADPLNLARRPFVNTRPVVRVAAILWLLGIVLMVLNVALFEGYLSSSEAVRGRLDKAQRDTSREQDNAAALKRQIGNLDLEQQNRKVAFLNHKIDERTFSWGLLLDRLADVLPDQVRVLRLTPTSLVPKDQEAAMRAGREPKPQPFLLSLTCEAKDDEAMLRFVDNLFVQPAFANPNLASEARQDSGLVKFELSVQYQPKPEVRARAPQAPPRRSGRPGAAPPLPPATAAGVPSRARQTSPAGAGLVRVAPPPGGTR
jgi:Tfp pilus assembly protein PilN